MSLGRLVGLIRRTGQVAEAAPPAPDHPVGVPSLLRGSVPVWPGDAGSCNGCEVEVGTAFGPVYDVERYGARLVASPRHADALVVTGVVTRGMAEPLRRTLEAKPTPRLVIAVGDCARNCGALAGGYGVAGAVGDVVDVDLEVPGRPPTCWSRRSAPAPARSSVPGERLIAC